MKMTPMICTNKHKFYTYLKNVSIFCGFLTISGCCETRTVYVPVSSCAEPPAFTMPTLMVDHLTADANTKQKLEALKMDYGIMKKSIEECQHIVDGYRKPAQTTPQKKAD